MGEAFIISAVRTPVGVGKPEGALFPFSPVDLSAWVMQAALERAGTPAELVEDVIWGCVTPIGDQGANLGRLAVLKAGFPYKIPAVTLNRMCGSSAQSVHFAAQALLSGDMDIVLAGGVEMMSHQPLGADYPEKWPDDMPVQLIHQGFSAELMAEKWILSRERLDDYAYRSHLRAMNALQVDYFKSQILPCCRPDGRWVDVDEGVRIPPDRQKMAALRPVFNPDGVITAGNSSQISDGAAALLLASAKAVGRYNLAPMARVVTRVVIGSDPVLMLDGPILATELALKRSGLELNQIDVIEVNEAFACVALAWIDSFAGVDENKVNPNGGAIALGHPLGATGAILMTRLLYELDRIQGQFGLLTMCIGHGMATATIVERV